MNIAIILAAGISTRITQTDTPKQFIEMGNKPLILYTIEKFIHNINIDYVIVLCHPKWVDYMQTIVNKYHLKIIVIGGGNSRNESIRNALNYIEKNLEILDDDIIITHDGARIFINEEIINKNIFECQKYGAVNTVSRSIDTICVCTDNVISSIPDRNNIYQSQTPQTFKWSVINKSYKNIIQDTTDACGIVLLNNYPIHIILNNFLNLKITTDQDLEFAKFILENK